MPLKKDTKKEVKLDIENINETVTLSKKILKVLFVCMIIGVILLVTIIAQKWHVPNFIFSFLKILTPLFIGYVIAWLFNPLVNFLNRNGFKRGLAVVAVYLGFIAILYLFMSMLIPTVVNQFNDLVSSFPNILASIKNFINNFLNNK